MRQSLAGISNCLAALSVALLAAVMAPASPDVALSDASGSGTLTSTAPPAPACGSNELELHEPSPDSEPGCATAPRTPEEIAEARAYLIETASPGYTMTLQGAELAIGRLHPEFAVRLENATYGPRDHAEWNHCQPTSVKIISAQNPLRETVSANLLRSKATKADPWVIGLRRRRPPLVVAVALANKTARIAWAVMHRHENYQRVAAAA